MSEKSLRLAAKFAATLALVTLPAFSIVELTTHAGAPAASVASATTNDEAVEQTPTPTASKDTTGWD
ncbi:MULTISPECIES: hypothetical protein [unclassified Streptomyces]|uniref:hypothetical protein n=1 Tax=unclassified Streptomyces TaxID=2593676 RepID=UPI000F70C1D2|nr:MULTISPECIES: hypothetical protein [unclassified Streptomyces]AZM58174.1 hypothetical protein DLM49_00190 [Streptomyces sp. WAC 01438]RSM99024.1 hypothetical protein DMA10_07845 [Streptomyces sp. WAC 01420]